MTESDLMPRGGASASSKQSPQRARSARSHTGTARPAPSPAAAPGTGKLPLITLVLVLVFLGRLSPWMAADYWFDEVLTINDYALQARVVDVVGQYPAPNHHVLYSVILWGWLRIVNPSMLEPLVRLPGALFAAGAIAVAVLHWRTWLGPRAAIACGVTFAASLVVASFAWQLRGYALTMLLAAVATGGALELVAGSRRRGLMLSLPAMFMLPLVLPTNALLLAALGAFLVIARPRDVSWATWTARVLVPVTLAGAVGCSYYLIHWRTLPRILEQAEGWSSAWAVAGAWGIGLIAHFGVVLLLFLWRQRGLMRKDDAAQPRDSTAPAARAAPADGPTIPRDRDDLVRCWQLLVPVLVIVTIFLVVQRPAPFPRTFLVFLPTVTFAVFLACRGSPLWTRLNPWAVAAVIAVNGLAWHLVSDDLTTTAVARGERPQNLVMQYYRGRHAVSDLTLAVRRAGIGRRIALLADFHDAPVTRYYWVASDLPGERVMSTWLNPPEHWQARFGGETALAVQAATEEQARELIRTSRALPDEPPQLVRVMQVAGLALWTPAAPNRPLSSAPAADATAANPPREHP